MSNEIQKWSDSFMFTAEKSTASDGPSAYLLGAPVDPLGQIAACAKMYKGEVVRDLADVTDAERSMYLREIQKTALKMPLEAVHMHFMVEGLHRGVTHQMVRQRTAAFAQESTRFAVKEDLKEATALPPSLQETLSRDELAAKLREKYDAQGLHYLGLSDDEIIGEATLSDEQLRRLKWDRAVATVGDTYMELVNDGMAAEEARGLMPTNITTRLNYLTNLRSFYDTMALRVSDQAQFEWRLVVMHMAKAMQEYGKGVSYKVWLSRSEFDALDEKEHQEVLASEGNFGRVLIQKPSDWQWNALSQQIKPIEFVTGKPAFGANFDRPSRIGERVAAFARCGVPSSQWFEGSIEHSIPPIHPEEYLMDPNSARLNAGEEFDIFGNRVPKGKGMHWEDGSIFTNNGQRKFWNGVDLSDF